MIARFSIEIGIFQFKRGTATWSTIKNMVIKNQGMVQYVVVALNTRPYKLNRAQTAYQTCVHLHFILDSDDWFRMGNAECFIRTQDWIVMSVL